jgi:ferredoxin
MTLVSANDPHKPLRKQVKLNEEICLGCGVCFRTCSHDGLRMAPRAERVITPVNSVHRIVMMAIERGGLEDLVFDNRVLWNHRALAAVLGVILRLPPLKQAVATRQFKSQYLGTLINKLNI